jgi:hypothetical protein
MNDFSTLVFRKIFSIQMALYDFCAEIVLRNEIDKAKAGFYSVDLHLPAEEDPIS